MGIDMKLKKPVFIICIFFFLMLVWSGSLPLNCFGAEDEEERVIRVGFPIQKGLTEVDSHGNFIGYTYDYLMEIAQYVNWKYEFVQVEGTINEQLSTLLDMLLKGEIDLMGAMVYHDSTINLFDYSGYNYGMSYSTLFALNKNTKINSSNYTTLGKLKIALYKDATQANKKLDQFIEMNGLDVEKIYYESQEEKLESLLNGEVDLLFDVDINYIREDLKIIARFAPEPFYFATSKGNTEIVNMLNQAISDINLSNPFFMPTLYEKYFSIENRDLYLSDEEKKYIDETERLKVLMFGGKAPIQYKDEKTGEMKGISMDVLNYISNHTGLKFEIVWTESFKEFDRLIKEKKIDIVAGVDNCITDSIYKEYYNTILPYIDAPILLAVNKKVNPNELSGKTAAISKENVNHKKNFEKVVYFDTVKECLDAVYSGKADYYYGNSYLIQSYVNSQGYKDILMLPESELWSQKIGFGIIKPVNIILATILNKTIQSISQNELQSFLYQNAYQMNEFTLGSYIKANPLESGLICILIIFIIIIIILFYNAYNYKKSSEKSRLENKRYEQLSELSNEYLYEYNIIKDRLSLPEKCAQFLECDKVIEHLSKYVKEKENKKEVFQYIISAAEGSKEVVLKLLDGNSYWLRIISKIIVSKSNIPIYSVGKIIDIQQEKEKQNILLEKSQKDSLTGIYNSATSRQFIDEWLKNSLIKYKGALFIIDIDYFKQVNDTYGHYIGDVVLSEVAKILKQTFREEDIVGRMGGDEFIIFMKNIKEKDILKKKCKYLSDRVKEIELSEGKKGISMSIGIAVTREEQEYEELYKRADKALYVVKERGRNGYEIV